jgi:hypothetical protein
MLSIKDVYLLSKTPGVLSGFADNAEAVPFVSSNGGILAVANKGMSRWDRGVVR